MITMTNEHLSLDSIVTISDDVAFRDLEGEAVMLNLESSLYFGLNHVGTRIWFLIQEYRSLRKVFEAMRAQYRVNPEMLERDLFNLVEKLRAKGLVTVRTAEERQYTGA